MSECIQEYQLILPNFFVLQADLVRDGIRKLNIFAAFNENISLSVVVTSDMD